MTWKETKNYFISLPQNVHTYFGPFPVSYSTGTGVLPRGYSGWGVKLTAHLHFVPSLTMSVAILKLSLHAFLEWKGTALRLALFADGKLNRKCKCEWNR
jgi:hypothetical protein